MKLPLTLVFRQKMGQAPRSEPDPSRFRRRSEPVPFLYGTVESDPATNDIAAVLLFGATPSDWLAVLCAAGVPTHRLTFLPLSHHAQTSVFGALVAGEAIRDHVGSLRDFATARPDVFRLPPLSYRCLAGRLYVPLEAELAPQVTIPELQSMLPAVQAHRLVWHPSAGLIEFDADQVLSTADLLSGPRPSPQRWNLSTFGDQLNDRIRSLNPVATLEELASIIQQGRDDIGQDANDIRNAPRAPDEIPFTKLNDAMQWMKRQAAKTVFNITNKLPTSPTGSPLLGKLHQWAAQMLSGSAGAAGAAAGAAAAAAAMSSGLSTQRENELKRLLHMLEHDPDRGLKYALPLFGNSSRGVAPPSGRLGERIPDFDLSQLGRSGRADAWDVPWQYHAKLTQKYRELAQRETRLGNHRRAAYIYASLLHDLNSAAAALEAGKLFRDAAAIYQVHLRSPLKAAACLKSGGMWEEAVVLYREHKQWMTAGELYGLLNQPESAAEMYEHELSNRLQQSNYFEAATLAIESLHDRERGWKLLRDGWVAQRRGADCLRRLFQGFADAGQHQRTETVFEDVMSQLLANQMPDATTICSEVATTYPTAAVRDLARRRTWQLASSLLSRESEVHSKTALQAIQSLAKEDELLVRDTSRFATLQKAQAKQKADAQPARRPSGLTVGNAAKVKALQSFPRIVLQARSQPKLLRWTSAAATSGYLFCIGETSEQDVVVGRWTLASLAPSSIPDGACVTFPLMVQPTAEQSACQLRVNPIRPDRIDLQRLPEEGTLSHNFVTSIVRANSFVDSVNVAGFWILDVQFISSGHWYAMILENDAQPKLVLSGSAGVPTCSFPLTLPESARQNMINSATRVYLGDSHVLVVAGCSVYRATLPAEKQFHVSPANPLELECVLEMDSDWTGFIPSQPHSVPRVLIATKTSCYAVWVTTGDSCRIASDLQAPVIGCTRQGTFIVATPTEISCYHVHQKKTERIATIESQTSEIVSIVPDSSPGDFLAIRSDGILQRFRIPVQ